MSDLLTEESPPSTEITYAFIADPKPDQVDQIIDLYRQAGWWSDADDADLAVRIVSGSFLFAAALKGTKMIGMGRVISDGASDAYIQDVTVDPALRGRGIGSQLVKMLIEKLESLGIGWIGLIAEKNSHPFYTPLGFKIMPDSHPMLIDKQKDHQK